MAATGAQIRVPVAVACRVLGLSTAGYYKWLKDPVSQREWDDAHLIDVLYGLHGGGAALGAHHNPGCRSRGLKPPVSSNDLAM